MPITEKLKRLTSMTSPKKLAVASGLKPTTVFNYIQGRVIPRADKAVALADALGVDVRWLLDDRQGWPPVRAEHADASAASAA
jgi:transcriptional regulator with XRE-family HTH domain